MLDLHFALFLKLLDRGRHCKIGGKIKYGSRRKFCIHHRGAIRERTSKRIPTRRNVSPDLVESVLLGFRIGRGGRGNCVQQKKAKQTDAKLLQFLHEVSTPQRTLGGARCGTSRIVCYPGRGNLWDGCKGECRIHTGVRSATTKFFA